MNTTETTAFYALFAPIFLLLVGLEAAVAKWRGRPVLSFANSCGNLSAGLGALFVGMFVGPFVVWLYSWAYERFALIHWAEHSLWCWLVALLLADMTHYWQHRFDHKFAPLWAMHGVHHQGTEVNLTISMRHTWGSDFYSFPYYFALPLLGIPPFEFFACLAIMSVHAMITHSSELRFPSLGIFVTPQSHRLHHARDAAYIDSNYGGMFCIWDKIFGTHVHENPANPPVYGVERGYGTHDGALCQWHQMRDFIQAWLPIKGFLNRLRALGLSPRALADKAALEPWPVPPANSNIPGLSKLYVALQLSIVVAVSIYVLDYRDQFSWTFKIGMTAFMLASLLALGGILDQRLHARRFEILRIVCSILVFSVIFVFHLQGK